MTTSLNGPLPALHGAEVLQAEVVFVHHDSPGRCQAKLGGTLFIGGLLPLLILLTAFSLGIIHFIDHQVILERFYWVNLTVHENGGGL